MEITKDTETMPQVVKKRQRILSKTLIVFMVAMVFANIASEMYATMLPLYMKYLGADVLQIGIFFTVSQIVPLVLQVLGGWVSDTIGRLRSVAIGSLIGLGAFISPIFIPTWQWLYLSETQGLWHHRHDLHRCHRHRAAAGRLAGRYLRVPADAHRGRQHLRLRHHYPVDPGESSREAPES